MSVLRYGFEFPNEEDEVADENMTRAIQKSLN